MTDPNLLPLLQSIADSLSRLAPQVARGNALDSSDAFVWQAEGWLEPVPEVSRVHINLLRGIDRAKEMLIENTERFARGLPANNALLWGARGTGKSSLVKATHAQINEKAVNDKSQTKLKLIEIHREDLISLPKLLGVIRSAKHRCVIFCDDLSFDTADTSYKSLKAVLEGGIEG